MLGLAGVKGLGSFVGCGGTCGTWEGAVWRAGEEDKVLGAGDGSLVDELENWGRAEENRGGTTDDCICSTDALS